MACTVLIWKKAFDSSLILFEHFSSVRSEKSGLVEILFHATFPLLMLRIIETGPWRVLVRLTFKLGLKLFNCLCISRSSCRKGNDYLGFGVCLETQHPLFQWTLLTSTLNPSLSSWEKPFIIVMHLHFLYIIPLLGFIRHRYCTWEKHISLEITWIYP